MNGKKDMGWQMQHYLAEQHRRSEWWTLRSLHGGWSLTGDQVGKSSLLLLSQSSGNRRRAVLLPLGLLIMSMAVFGWGLQYKLSLYQGKGSIAHLTPEAKLLSQKERPAANRVASSPEVPSFAAFPVLLVLIWTSGLCRAAARYVRTGSRERSRAAAPSCLEAIFLRPPPARA
jgi:hypothetical protein